MTDMTIANTILSQLGGNKFLAMTGAKDLVGGERYLGLRLPARFAKDGITHVRVTLTLADLYTVAFYKIRGVNIKTVAEFDNVHAEQLRDTFTHATGWETSLGTMRA